MHPRVVEALLLSAFNSDHEGIIKQVDDLIVMTKLIHPELAYKVTKEMEAEEKQRLLEIEYRKQKRAEDMEWNARQEAIMQNNDEIRRGNLMIANGLIKDLYEKTKQPFNYDKLGYQEQSLINQVAKFYPSRISRCGFLWMNVQWHGLGPGFVLNENHGIYEYLKKHRFDLFKEVSVRKSSGFFMTFEEYSH